MNIDLVPNDITFKNMEKTLNFILSQENNKSHNINILKEIGLAKQYTSIIDNKISNDKLYISKNHKTLKNYIPMEKSKSYFVKWTSVLFDINEDNCNYSQKNTRKIENLRNRFLYKMFFQKNVKKNIIENESNINLFKYGIPKYLREFIWEIIIAEKFSNKKYFNREEEQKEYNSFLTNINKNKINTQIEKDITRTFSDISYQTEQNLKILKNLMVFTSSLTKDGYCQGMNFIVGFILTVTNFDEIKSYYILKYIFPKIKGYFENGFPLLKKNMNLFYKLFSKLYPKLHIHFAKNGVFAQFWVGRWLQTLFTLSLPFDELCFIWDLLLIKGFDFSIYISLAIVYYLEKYLMKLDDSSDILSYLKNSLNPEEKYGMNISNESNIKKKIIPLKKIFLKSLEIEDKIKSDKTFQEIIMNSKNEDCDSICTKFTKESDTAISIKKFNLHDSSHFSTISSQSINILPKINPINKQNAMNNTISNNMEDKKLLNFNNNNLVFNNVNNYNNSFNSNNENKKTFHLFENIDLTKRNFYNNYNVNNDYKYFNLNYFYNNYAPTMTQNYLFINTTLVFNYNPGVQYNNSVVFCNV